MLIEVEHETLYEYDEPVQLGPQTVRLRPRLSGALTELRYSLDVDPEPAWRVECLDANGNRVTRLELGGATRHLRLLSKLAVETGGPESYQAHLAPDLARLPACYPSGEVEAMRPYLDGQVLDVSVGELALRLRREAGDDALAFLHLANRWLHELVVREIRPMGVAQSPAETLSRRSGACRDQSVLFMALCRSVGLAARFVSGYQDRSALETDRRYLHAWPEVYLPGAGWYGYDPTRGAVAADGHVPLAAAREPSGAMPVEGCYYGVARSRLDFALAIRVVSKGSGTEPTPDVGQVPAAHR